MTKFPKLIHVTEETTADDDAYLVVLGGGVLDVEESGQEVAIYQLVRVGCVDIAKTFREKKR